MNVTREFVVGTAIASCTLVITSIASYILISINYNILHTKPARTAEEPPPQSAA